MEKEINIYQQFLKLQKDLREAFRDDVAFRYKEKFFLETIVFNLNLNKFYLCQIMDSSEGKTFSILTVTHISGALLPLGKVELVGDIKRIRHDQISLAFGLDFAKLEEK